MDKATGDDDVPTEFFEAVQEARQDLYAVVRRVFNELEIPDNLVTIVFVMIYKGAKKGTVNEFTSYRPYI
eukprot:SAG11_NODE_12079_length_723_cov_0.599359_1_plen_70_part_00